jgi:hypothetical protein
MDEQKIREIIAEVRAVRESLNGSVSLLDEERLIEIERKLGGLLPPVGGVFNINLSDLIKR